MKILLTGSNGFVGREIYNMYRDVTVCAPSMRGLSQDEITEIVEDSGVDVIVNTAAIADMWQCEADPDASYLANVQIPVYLANAAKGKKLICFSSDQVYNGSEYEGPYKEGDECPVNVYAKHKLEMEKRVLDIIPSAVMLRAEWMYGLNSTKEDYYSILKDPGKKLTFSSKEYRGVTYIKEVAENIKKAAFLPGGAYNYGSETEKTMLEITKEFAEYIDRRSELTDSQGGHNLWMNCSKARSYGIEFSSVIEGLKKCEKDSRTQNGAE